MKKINRLRKEINRLFCKGMSTIYLGYYWEKLTLSKRCRYHWILNFLVKNQKSGNKTMCSFSIILILKGIMMF